MSIRNIFGGRLLLRSFAMVKKNIAGRRTFWWTVCIVFVVVCTMDLAVWFGLQMFGNTISPLVTAAPGLSEVTTAIQTFHSLEQRVLLYALPGTFILFLLAIGAFRLLYRSGLKPEDQPFVAKKTVTTSESAEAREEKRVKDQRLFLHLISLLQREGRLIDFFAEDLSSFDDAQIGAAVREIHATCRKVVEKSLSLKPVIDNIEGETVSVDQGFDPTAIKLIGNVTGKPPFSGVLRHRGWQAGKAEVPTLSGSQDPTIIAPAEVEIL